MPSKNICAQVLRKAAGRGKITGDQADQIIKDIIQRADNDTTNRSRNRAYKLREAAETQLGVMEFERLNKKRNEVLTYNKLNELSNYVKSHPDPFGAIVSSVKIGFDKRSGIRGVAGKDLSLESQTLAVHTEYIQDFTLGLESVPGLMKKWNSNKHAREIEIELANLNSKDGKPGVTKDADALKMAEVIHTLFQRARRRMNQAGADIGHLDGRTVMQTWEGQKVRDAGGRDQSDPKAHHEASFQAFNRAVRSFGIDEAKTFGSQPGESFMRFIHKEMYAEDFSRMEIIEDADGNIIKTVDHSSSEGGGRSMASKLSSSRVIHFTTAEGHMKAREAFGRHPKFSDAVEAQFTSNARSIASMEKFGPDPERGYAHLVNVASKLATESLDASKRDPFRSNFHQDNLRSYWKIVSGQTENVSNSPWARAQEWILTGQSVSKLQNATISSITDPVFSMIHLSTELGLGKIDTAMRLWRAMPSAFNAFGKYSSDGNANSLFYKMNYVLADTLSGEAGMRFGADFSMRDGSVTKWINKKFFKLNFLSQWTNSMKAAVFRVHASFLGEMSHLKFEDLPPEVSTGLMESGITSAEWNIIRGGAKTHDGIKMLGPDLLDELDTAPLMTLVKMKDTPINRERAINELRTKVISYFHKMQDSAVPTPGVTERSVASAGGKSKDTIMGFVMPIAWQFKAFPTTVVNKVIRQGARTAEFRGKKGSHYINMAAAIAGTTVMGYVSGMFKDLLRGRTPKSLKNPKTWLDAAMRGGAMGIYADIMMKRYDRGMNKFSSTLAGPFAGSVLDPAFALMWKAAEGDGKGAGKIFKDMVAQNFPKAGLAHSLVIKPIWDAMIWDSINRYFDPDMDTKIQDRLDDNGQRLIWK